MAQSSAQDRKPPEQTLRHRPHRGVTLRSGPYAYLIAAHDFRGPVLDFFLRLDIMVVNVVWKILVGLLEVYGCTMDVFGVDLKMLICTSSRTSRTRMITDNDKRAQRTPGSRQTGAAHNP